MADISVQAALAVGLAQLKQPGNAFRHAEASLGRGLLDDLAGLSTGQRQRAVDLRTQMAKLEPILASFSSRQELTDEQKARQEAAKREYGRLWREWSNLFATASERAVLPLERIQRSIPDDAALVLWIEQMGERWGCVVRSAGSPRWQKLDTNTAGKQLSQLYSSLTDPASNDKQREKLLAAFRKERLDPLRPYLKGVKQLFVVPTGQMAYIPADLLAEGFLVRYLPSGSVLARTRENHRALDGTSLLAVGDPIFDKADRPPNRPRPGSSFSRCCPTGSPRKPACSRVTSCSPSARPNSNPSTISGVRSPRCRRPPTCGARARRSPSVCKDPRWALFSTSARPAPPSSPGDMIARRWRSAARGTNACRAHAWRWRRSARWSRAVRSLRRQRRQRAEAQRAAGGGPTQGLSHPALRRARRGRRAGPQTVRAHPGAGRPARPGGAGEGRQAPLRRQTDRGAHPRATGRSMPTWWCLSAV